LWYLSLFLCHRFGVIIPISASSPNISHAITSDAPEQNEPLLLSTLDPEIQSRAQAAGQAPAFPVYMLLLPYIPLGLAIFIAGTRYFDFRNHGFDVLAGAVIGSVTAFVGYKIYHLSLFGAERVV
jgi:hypothetical protein